MITSSPRPSPSASSVKKSAAVPLLTAVLLTAIEYGTPVTAAKRLLEFRYSRTL